MKKAICLYCRGISLPNDRCNRCLYIPSVESQDESIAIYHAAPYRLEQMRTDVDAALKQLYRKHKHTIVSRDTFLNECKMFNKWLKAE